MSLKTKFQYVYTIGSVIILTALVSGVLLSIKGMNMLTNTLDSNEKAIDLYRAVVMERNTLKLYFEDAQEISSDQVNEARNNTKSILKQMPADYKEISFVCLRPDGCLELPTTLGTVCRKVAKTLEGFEGFHFHQLRHTYASNLLANGAAPKDVQELLGHSDVSTTMNVYAHSTRDAKRKSVRLLDKVVGND